MLFFAPLRELQLPGASSAPPPDVALPRPLMPRPPASPSPPSQCVSVTQRRFEAEGPSGAPPPPPLQRQHQQREQQQRQRQEQRLQRPCSAIGSACSPGELTTKRARAPLRSALLGARLRAPLGLAGLGRLAGRRRAPRVPAINRCSRRPRARPGCPRSGPRGGPSWRSGHQQSSGECGAGKGARGAGGAELPPSPCRWRRGGARARPSARPPAGRRRGAEFAAPHPALWEEAPL